MNLVRRAGGLVHLAPLLLIWAVVARAELNKHARAAKSLPDVATQPEADFDAALEEQNGDARERTPRARRNCLGTRGKWCGRFDKQVPIPTTPAPRGNVDCPANCNGIGQCNHADGICRCPAGCTGVDCKLPFKRPCTHRKRDRNDPNEPPMNHTDADGRDLNWLTNGWTSSRCGGICDTDTARCWCDNPTYGWVPAPAGSPPGTPPLQRGRPLAEHCKPSEDKAGRKVEWGHTPYANLYGKDGWCTAAHPRTQCGCSVDGLSGPMCTVVTEQFCLLQCTRHGTCSAGFCKCFEGWYGADCSLKRAGLAVSAGEVGVARPWLDSLDGLAVPPPAAADVPAAKERRRPLIFVYDMPPEFTTRMLQYRSGKATCVWRTFNDRNSTHDSDYTYGVETYLHEMMLSSEHRTFDPEEADFFYVPTYVACWMWPVYASADVPWWGPPTPPRVMHASNMVLKAKHWLQQASPWWDRRGGSDHIWVTPHDEGACWMPTEIFRTSIMLTHWGRMDANHQSCTAYTRDNYSEPVVWPGIQDIDWTIGIKGHVCYDPTKDLVIPTLKWPVKYSSSPLLGCPDRPRTMLAYFRGDVGDARLPIYSRGIRQTLNRLSKEKRWRDKYSIFIGDRSGIPGTYSDHLATSVFCLVLPGDGFATRAEDAILHGCIPVIIMDQVHAVFESILRWDTFSVRLTEASMASLPLVLQSITPPQVARMQRRITQVWHRFAYTLSSPLRQELDLMYALNARKHPTSAQVSGVTAAPPAGRRMRPPLTEFPLQDDAWHTIIQWLYSRIPDTRGGPAGKATYGEAAMKA